MSSIAPESTVWPSDILLFCIHPSYVFVLNYLLSCARLRLPARVSFHIAQASKVLSTPVTIVKMPMIKLTFVSAEMLRGYSAIEVSNWLENNAPRNKLVEFVDGYFLG